MSIYPLFKKKIEKSPNKELLNVLISFESLTDREKFIKKSHKIKIISKFDYIPSIFTKIDKEEVISLEKQDLIKQIEEDQRIYFSMFDVMEILELDYYQNTEISYKGNGIKVGIIDDGINQNFPSILKAQINLSEDNNNKNINSYGEEISHGTIMAGIIGNQFKDIDGNYLGIAPKVKFFDFQLTTNKKEYFISDILRILDQIKKLKIEIDILLIPLTTSEPSDGKDLLSIFCNLLVEGGLIIVSPSGNLGSKNYTIGSPGAAEKVITVGALTKDFTIASFSGKGPTLDERLKPDLCFPGSNIIIPLSNNLRVKASGTSVSAAIGVGIIALIKNFDPTLSYEGIIDLLKKSSIDLNYEPTSQGMGTVNVPDIFKNLDLLNEKIVPYNYLVKRSIKIVLEFLLILIVLFYIINFFKFI
ncbi:MAG: S8 family serine peptidase [Candidatus Thorarchaeota archaeon]